MAIGKAGPDNFTTECNLSDKNPEKSAPPYTTSLDASFPGERIISVRYDDRSKKWIAIQRNTDGSLHEGVGNTEPLARRIAALKGFQFAKDNLEQRGDLSSAKESEKYLRWKDDLRTVINEQREIINRLIVALGGSERDLVDRPEQLAVQKDMISSVIMMVQAIGVSCNSIYQLSGGTEMTVRDCYSVARSIVETSVNAAFIQASGAEMAQRAHRHALQKYFRDLDRKAKIGDLNISAQYTGEVDLTSVPGLAEALAEFTTEKGHEVRSWTPETIDQKIKVIASKYGKSIGRDFGVGRFSIYRHSSEILHGTHFGARYFWQPSLVTDVGRSMETMIKHLFDHFLTVFNGVYNTVDALFSVFDAEYGLPEVRNAKRALHEEFRNLEFIKDALGNTRTMQADTKA